MMPISAALVGFGVTATGTFVAVAAGTVLGVISGFGVIVFGTAVAGTAAWDVVPLGLLPVWPVGVK